ncbi:membrane protein DedA with SNARE-associated domain [Bacillus tianshenii]|uniref:Membrane protein DedA with SNARE-associated domain n=1 Tax=Sutcliffiella tianshenii TaxID=1463404 RepID=A0ABS2P1L9_9BACI|nr:DedA family protein [Bacillus tianshenii]MBM7620842.1 membrane protein DedA with SNARE-associated domain [Bacillus tianshenii]
MEHFFLSVFEVFTGLGVLGIALGLMIEIIPSEIVLGYGGYLISKGEVGFMGATVAGVVGGTLAQLFLYWAGSIGGRPFLEKYGKFVFIHPKHLDISERWFQEYGPIVIFTARFIPVVRHAISIPAGIAKMRFVPFLFYTVAAVIPWTILFLFLGFQLGENWRDIKQVAQPLVIPIMILIILGAITYFVFDRKRG